MIVADTPEKIALLEFLTLRKMLGLEILGIKPSRGRKTAYATVKEKYGFRGSRQSVYDQMSSELPDGIK